MQLEKKSSKDYLTSVKHFNYRHRDIANLLFYFPLKKHGSFLLEQEIKEDRALGKGTLFWSGVEEIVIVQSVYQSLQGDGAVEENKRFPYMLADWLQRTVGQGLPAKLQTPQGILPYYDYLMKHFKPTYKQLKAQYKDFGF